MLKIGLIAVVIMGLFIYAIPFTNGHNKDIEKMMTNKQTRSEIFDYMINHQNLMKEFMGNALENKNSENWMMNYMMDNRDSRWNMMDFMFNRANSNKEFYQEMQKYMNNHGYMMSMMQGMMGYNMNNGSMGNNIMNHNGMMGYNNQSSH